MHLIFIPSTISTFSKSTSAQLVEFAQGLNAEDKRGIAENLTEEELAIFDLLTKPEINLNKKEEHEVKKVA